jgi:ATP-dependent RNA helicase DeaD
MDAKNIGRIDIEDDHSLLDLPDGLPDDLINKLKGVRISGRQLHISRVGEQAERASVPTPAPRPTGREPAPAPAPRAERAPREAADERAPRERPARDTATERAPKKERKGDIGMERYRIEVGSTHGVKPANIVGAIANEAGLEAKYIGHIDIFDDHSVVDLPEGMPKELLQHLKTVWVAGQQLRISHADGPPAAPKAPGKRPPLTVPKRGAERRVEERKTHRKGGKPK